MPRAPSAKHGKAAAAPLDRVEAWHRRRARGRRLPDLEHLKNVGAVADPLAVTYDVSLAAVGLLTTALFVTHLAVQLPAGRGADRFGWQRVALLAIAAAVAGNALLLLDDGFELALLGRAVVGLGSGAGFVAGLDLVRAGGGGPIAQGLYGGATMAGGGLALMVVPPLTDATSWRAAYWSAAALALLATVPTLAAQGLPRIGHAGRGSSAIDASSRSGSSRPRPSGSRWSPETGRCRSSSARASAPRPPGSRPGSSSSPES